MGAKNPLRWAASILGLAAATWLIPASARAEADAFGTGDGHSGAKTVAGTEVVNTYAALTADAAAGATTLQVSSTVLGAQTPFASGDLVLVWRATGVAASEAPSGNQTKRLDLSKALATTSAAGVNAAGLVGLYEFARVQSVAGTTLTLTAPLVRGFTKNVSQVVRVPEYTNVTVPAGATLVPTAWQRIGDGPGWAGGMLIFLAKGTVSNAGRIHANGRGFHGGLPPSRPLNLSLVCKNDDGDPAKGYAEKGEGVVQSAYKPDLGGKGNVSMAGGGGNCIEAGGGGGANFGSGGAGGTPILNAGVGGLGGVGIDYSLLDRITMGGGGGAGEQKNGQASSGGFGGGAIYVRANALTGKGTLEAKGDTAQNSGILGLPPFVESDGAGGGGAGGSIFLRLIEGADCSGVQGVGGDGGSTGVIGQTILGPGGGGGGGRVLLQAGSVTDTCKVDVTPGKPGDGGNGGSGGGTQGGSEKPPSGGFCFSNDPGSTTCADPKPVCDLTDGACKACEGPFGGGDLGCPSAGEPVCLASGACVPCDGDLGSGEAQACQLGTSPYCVRTGAHQGECGKCTGDADCAGADHAGPKCHVPLGACGTACNGDADCKGTEWCSSSVCVPKTPNGQPLPNVDPIDGECTDDHGKRVCLSAVCEPGDDQCGLANGKPCDGNDTVCRSNTCFPADRLCGKPGGEPCTTDGECRTNECKDGVCVGCNEDTDCKAGEICNGSKQCESGCREVDGKSHCPPPTECSAKDGSVGTCVDPTNDGGTTGPGDADGGDDAGTGTGTPANLDTSIEGGGCSCRTTVPSEHAPTGTAAIVGLALAGLAVERRRRKRRDGIAERAEERATCAEANANADANVNDGASNAGREEREG